MPDQAPGDEALEFAGAFRAFLDWIHIPATAAGNEVPALVRDFLGPGGARHSVVTRELPAFEHVNLQTAIDAWSAQAGRAVQVRGIALPPHYGGLSLQQLVAGDALPPPRLTAPALDDLLDAARAVTRTLPGVGVDPADLPPGGALTPGPGRAGPMMYARRAKMVRRFGPYGG